MKFLETVKTTVVATVTYGLTKIVLSFLVLAGILGVLYLIK